MPSPVCQMVRKLRTTYSHPNDVDLIVGGMAERPADDSMVGPTFRCLIYEQFSRSRRTDRYFYDSALQPHPFASGKPSFRALSSSYGLYRCDFSPTISRLQSNWLSCVTSPWREYFATTVTISRICSAMYSSSLRRGKSALSWLTWTLSPIIRSHTLLNIHRVLLYYFAGMSWDAAQTLKRYPV